MTISLWKFILLFFLIFAISTPLHPIERQQRYINKYTFIYVPVKYPKTEKEIIKNIRYRFEKNSGGLKGIFENRRFSNKRKFQLAFLAGLVKVSRIIKVWNYCARKSCEYEYIIEISNKSGVVKQFSVMRDDGSFGMSTEGNLKAKMKKIHADEEIYKDLAKCDLVVTNKDVKKSDWISAYAQHVEGFRLPFDPVQKLTLADGRIFYKIHKKIYKVIHVHEIGNNTKYKSFRSFRMDNPRKLLMDYSVSNYVEELSLL